MAIEDLLGKIDIFDELGFEDAKAIEAARSVVERVPVSTFGGGDNVDKGWFRDNLESQEGLLNLRVRLAFLKNSLELQNKVSYGETLDVDRDELLDYRSRSDRESFILARDGSMRDKNESTIKLDCILQYVDGLLWIHRDLMRLYNK